MEKETGTYFQKGWAIQYITPLYLLLYLDCNEIDKTEKKLKKHLYQFKAARQNTLELTWLTF